MTWCGFLSGQDPNEDLGLGFPYDTFLGESRLRPVEDEPVEKEISVFLETAKKHFQAIKNRSFTSQKCFEVLALKRSSEATKWLRIKAYYFPFECEPPIEIKPNWDLSHVCTMSIWVVEFPIDIPSCDSRISHHSIVCIFNDNWHQKYPMIAQKRLEFSDPTFDDLNI